MTNKTETVACPTCGEPVETWFNEPAEVECACGAMFLATPPKPEVSEKTT